MIMSFKTYYIYILRNNSGTLYVGVTNNIIRRLWEHKQKVVQGFTQKYHIDKLIYYEEYQDPQTAIAR